MKYILGLLVIVVGFFLVVKTGWFIQNFGHSAWAEEKLGGGGTRSMYKIIGVLLIFGTVLAITGALGEIILAIFGNLFAGL